MNDPQAPAPPTPTAFRRREFLTQVTRPLAGGGILMRRRRVERARGGWRLRGVRHAELKDQ